MKTRKNITTIISILLIVAAIYLLARFHLEIQKRGSHFEYHIFHSVSASLLVTFITFMTIRNWFEFFIEGNIRIGFKLLIPAIVIMILGAVPNTIWITRLGLELKYIGLIYYSAYAHLGVNAIAGVLLGRSFHKRVSGDDGLCY